MSVDSKAIIRANVSLEQIVSCLSVEYSHVEVVATHIEHFFRFVIGRSNTEDYKKCILWASFDFETTFADFGIKGVYISTNYRHPEGVNIVKLLCETFGGYFDECDCDDEDHIPVNVHLLEQIGELSEIDKFKHKAIAKFRFSKLADVLGLLDEYVAITNIK